jgi:hypothetical protein
MASVRRRVGAASILALALALALTGCGVAQSDTGAATPTLRPTVPTTPPPARTPLTSPVAPAVHPVASTPCTRNRHAKWVVVSLASQHLWMCAGTRVAGDSAITSGLPGQYTETPTGKYRIQGFNRNSTLTLNTGATYDVKYWIPFDAPLFGFHDSSWQDFPYGSPRYKTKGSHGCVHMPLAAIRFLYRWADVGTPVTIRA